MLIQTLLMLAQSIDKSWPKMTSSATLNLFHCTLVWKLYGMPVFNKSIFSVLIIKSTWNPWSEWRYSCVHSRIKGGTARNSERSYSDLIPCVFTKQHNQWTTRIALHIHF